MEISELINLVKKYIILIAILALIGGVIGASSANFFSSGFKHQRLYFLTDPVVASQISDTPNSESFSLQEKSRNFTDTAVAILDSPDFKNEVLARGDSLQVRKVAPQVIRLTLVSNTPDTNFSKLQKVSASFNLKIQDLTASTPSSILKPVGLESSPVYSSLSRQVLFVFGVVLGTVFALLVIGLKNYYRI